MITNASLTETVRSAFPFTVDKFPLSGPDGMRTPHYGLFRSDNGECVGNATRKGYEPHTVDEVLALCEAASDAFDGECNVKCYFSEGHYVTVAPSNDYRRAIFGTADNIWPRLIIRAGYDGKAFHASLGFYRDACRNLAMIRSDGQSVSASIRHTSCLREKMGILRHSFERLAASWDGVVSTAREMEARPIELAPFLRDVYPLADDASNRTRTSHERRVEVIVNRIVRERAAIGRPALHFGGPVMVSAWEAFNGVQGYVQHDQRRRGGLDDYGRAIAALEDSAVARALEFALAA